MRRRAALVFALWFGAACSTPLAPEFRVFAPIDRSQPPIVFVSSDELRGSVEASLARAGFTVTQTGREATLFLAASFGGVRSESEDCGPIRNVRFVLRQYGTVLASGVARGPTGECAGDVLDQMARDLAAKVLGDPSRANAHPEAHAPGPPSGGESAAP
jgi:hypothetical protein